MFSRLTENHRIRWTIPRFRELALLFRPFCPGIRFPNKFTLRPKGQIKKKNCLSDRGERRLPIKGLKYLPLSSRVKTLHLTPRATESGYEHSQTKILARTVAV